MKTNLFYTGISVLLLAATAHTRAEILSGPVTNPANGHEYYLLAPGSWPAAESEAEKIGGRLVIIKNAAEQKWVFAQFGRDGDRERSLWIGLHRQSPGGPFIWIDGSSVDYVNWYSGQPDNAGGNENCVHMWSGDNKGGYWNDAVENASLYGVVEVPQKSHEKRLLEKEKSLLGKWYESGRTDRAEWIAGTDSDLFQIYDGRAVRLLLPADGSLVLFNGICGEIVKDKILWSNGTWWSRKPVNHAAVE